MSYSYRIIDEKPETIWPQRVKSLFASYEKASKELSKKEGRKIEIEYQPVTEDLHEKIFEDMVRKKPESLKVSIYRIYRVKNFYKNGEEFYFYGATKVCQNARGDLAEPWCYDRYGYFERPIITMQYDEAMENKKPRETGKESEFLFKWDKKRVRELLDSSFIKCEQFYVGKAGKREPVEDRHYQIFCVEDFLEATFEELMSLGKFGISYEHPSRQLVPAAIRQERENREKNVGLRTATPATRAYG